MAVWSEVRLKSVGHAGRLEAQYYQPRYLAAETRLRKCGYPIKRLADLCERVTDGSHVTPDYQDEGVPFLMVRDVKEAEINFADPKFITYDFDRKLQHCKPKAGDILLTKVGTVGVAAVVPNHAPDFNIFVSLAVLKNIHGVQPHFLSTFLNSFYGRFQAAREAKGITQPDLHLEDIRKFAVPVCPVTLQDEISHLCERSQQERSRSLELYAAAQTSLLNALGLSDSNSAHGIVYERDFREVVRAGRFDAQYFHPEKYEVLEALKPMEGQSIEGLFESINQIVDAEDDFASEVQNYDLTDALNFFLPDIQPIPIAELGSSKKRFRRGDVVVSRLRSYLKEIALVAATSPACVGSTEFFVLRPRSERVSPELLLVYLRSEPVQKILRWCQDGSQHPRFKEEELLAIKLPDRLLTVQDEIVTQIGKAIRAYHEAQTLLAAARRRVEKIIEEGA